MVLRPCEALVAALPWGRLLRSCFGYKSRAYALDPNSIRERRPDGELSSRALALETTSGREQLLSIRCRFESACSRSYVAWSTHNAEHPPCPPSHRLRCHPDMMVSSPEGPMAAKIATPVDGSRQLVAAPVVGGSSSTFAGPMVAPLTCFRVTLAAASADASAGPRARGSSAVAARP